MKAIFKFLISLIVIIAVLAFMASTCPSEDKHKEAVAEYVKRMDSNAMTPSADIGALGKVIISGLNNLGSKVDSWIVKKFVVANDYIFFSIGSLIDDDENIPVSLGVFNHVFVFPWVFED